MSELSAQTMDLLLEVQRRIDADFGEPSLGYSGLTFITYAAWAADDGSVACPVGQLQSTFAAWSSQVHAREMTNLSNDTGPIAVCSRADLYWEVYGQDHG